MSGRFKRQVFLAGALLALAIASGASAATYRRMTLDMLVQCSDYVIYGRVVESQSLWDPATSSIWTRTEIQVLDGPKGQVGGTIAVTEPGGVVRERGELYPGTPQFQKDHECVLFLYRAPGNRVRVTGALQGVYAVVQDRSTGERLVQAAVPQPDVVYQEDSRFAYQVRTRAAGPETLSRFLYAIR